MLRLVCLGCRRVASRSKSSNRDNYCNRDGEVEIIVSRDCEEMAKILQ